MPDILPPDDLTGWTLPPPAARARGEVEPVPAVPVMPSPLPPRR